MAFRLKHERMPIEQGWGVLYLLPLYTKNKGGVMIEDQSTLVLLLEKMAQGDDKALSDFYDVTVNRVYGMAIKIVSRSELAEEVVSDVYLQIWRQAMNYNAERASPIGWILMICRSRALDILRREKSATRNQFQEDENDVSDDILFDSPLSDVISSETSKQVRAALELLTKQQRESISLAFFKDMSHREISEFTGQPLGTVKSNIRRAQDILRNILGKEALNVGGFYG